MITHKWFYYVCTYTQSPMRDFFVRLLIKLKGFIKFYISCSVSLFAYAWRYTNFMHFVKLTQEFDVLLCGCLSLKQIGIKSELYVLLSA